MSLHEDFTRHGKMADLGRWYVTGFVRSVAGELPEGVRVLDAGAGECVYKSFFSHCRYTAVDLGVGDSSWNYGNLDVIAALHRMGLESDRFDAVLCTQVLEHLELPAESLVEIHRVLRPGGKLYLTAPMSHPQHQQPYDFFRYTSFGLQSLLIRAGFSKVTVEPFGGMFIRWAYELPRALAVIPGAGLVAGKINWAGVALLPLKFAAKLFVPLAQRLCLFLDRFEKEKDDPFGWAVVAEK
ncbi:MAG: class I SAM-dependent methyltransferase [Thermoanaerobaculia bacterium]